MHIDTNYVQQKQLKSISILFLHVYMLHIKNHLRDWLTKCSCFEKKSHKHLLQ